MRSPLTPTERVAIYEGKLQGKSLRELAHQYHCATVTARKCWRIGRQCGVVGLHAVPRGRGPSGILSQFDPQVAACAEALKRAHPGWGAQRVLLDLRHTTDLQGLALPSASRLAVFFKARCPDCVASHRQNPPPAQGCKAKAVHEVWQLDNQEGVRLANGVVAIICNIRDPFGAAPITSQAFAGQTAKRWRKLEVAEFRQVLRAGFTEWHTLPDSVWTDNELRLIGNPSSDFPSHLTLYLVGLGIKHEFIRPGQPTDQAQVERGHRTLDAWAVAADGAQDLAQLQQALDHERQVYLHEFPCQASDCAGRPPLVAHPDLLRPRRYYAPALELALFDIQRVYDFLATFTFERRISTSGCISLGHQVSFGRPLVRRLKEQGKAMWVRCDPQRHEWVVYRKPTREEPAEVELARRPIRDLSVETLTGLQPAALPPAPQPLQLTLPFLAL